MSISESKNERKKAAAAQSVEARVDADIEEALGFLDSEEYQDVRSSAPGKETPDTGTHSAQSPQQKSSTVIKHQSKKKPRPSPVEQVPTQEDSAPLEEEKNKNSGKIWLLIMSIAILISLAILFLY